MQQLKLIDIDVDLPVGTALTPLPSDAMLGWSQRYRLEGVAVEHVRNRIDAVAAERGYKQVDSRPEHRYFERGNQRICLTMKGPGQLHISVDDPEQLPLAKVTESGVSIGPVSIALPGVRITPRRERYDPEPPTWIGEWDVVGKSPRDLSIMIVEAFAALGMRAWGPFEPKNPRIGDMWKSEASGSGREITIYVTQGVDHDLLRIEVYG